MSSSPASGAAIANELDAHLVRAETAIAIVLDRSRACAIADARLMAATIALADTVDEDRFQPDQVALTLGCSRLHAMSELEWGRDLIAYLPAVWTAWQAGDIDRYRAWIFANVLVTLFHNKADVAAAIADRVLPGAGSMPCARLRQKLRRLLIRADAHAIVARARKTIGDRHVYLSAGSESGVASIGVVHLPAARAAAAFERVDAIARARRNDGDLRTLEQLRADTFCDLLEGVDVGSNTVARPGIIELTIPLSTATGLSSEPADIAGYGPVVADIARQIAAARHDYQWRFSVTRDGELVYNGLTSARPSAELGPDQSLAQAATAIHTPRPPVQRNERTRFPSAKLRRWIVARDHICQAPGCSAPARVCDVDHVIDHASGGLTTHRNLILLCRHHHRAKHLGFLTPVVIKPGLVMWFTNAGQMYWSDG